MFFNKPFGLMQLLWLIVLLSMVVAVVFDREVTIEIGDVKVVTSLSVLIFLSDLMVVAIACVLENVGPQLFRYWRRPKG